MRTCKDLVQAPERSNGASEQERLPGHALHSLWYIGHACFTKWAVWPPSDQQIVASTSFSGLGQIFGYQTLTISARHSSTFFAASASLRCRRWSVTTNHVFVAAICSVHSLDSRSWYSSGFPVARQHTLFISIPYSRLKTFQKPFALRCFFQKCSTAQCFTTWVLNQFCNGLARFQLLSCSQIKSIPWDMHLHHYNVIASCHQLAVVSYHVLLISYHYVIWYVYICLYGFKISKAEILIDFQCCSTRPKMSQIFWSIGEWVTASRPYLARCAPWVSKPYAPWAAQSFSLLYEGPVKGETRNKSETNSSVQSSIRFSGKVWRCMSHCNLFLHVPHCATATSAMEDVTKVVQSLRSLSQKMSKVWNIEMSSCRCIWLFWCSCCTALPRLAWPRTTLPGAMTSAVIAPTLWLCVIRKGETVGSARCNALKLRTGYRYRRYTGIHITPHELE